MNKIVAVAVMVAALKIEIVSFFWVFSVLFITKILSSLHSNSFSDV